MSEHMQHMQRLQLAGTLASGIAHDLNNELTLVLGNLELALRQLPEGDAAQESLEFAKTAATRCADMSRRLLYLGRRVRTTMTRLDVSAAVIEAQQMLTCIAPANMRMTVDCEPALFIRGNATQMQQVLINLATNGFHSMPDGGELQIRAHAERNRVMVTVRDTGCGIPKSLWERIYQPFFTTRADAGGCGLGLTTVRSIVHGHGGVISLDSEPGKGSTFLLNFPVFEPATGDV